MRILVAVDTHPYSIHAVEQTAKLARNTWADVTILALQPKPNTGKGASNVKAGPNEPDPSLRKALHGYRESFLSNVQSEDSPYAQYEFGYELMEVRRGVWEELYVGRSPQKALNMRVRAGNAPKTILAEAGHDGADLIVVGCGEEKGCTWHDGTDVPQKVAAEATCSVLVVKKTKDIKKMICCLDHDRVSQESLEMVSQLVTLYGAELDIVGLAESEGLREEVERRMDWIMNYYAARNIKPWIEVVEPSSLQRFISQQGKWNLTALWMGNKSLLKKVFSRSKIGTLVQAGETSVLILR